MYRCCTAEWWRWGGVLHGVEVVKQSDSNEVWLKKVVAEQVRPSYWKDFGSLHPLLTRRKICATGVQLARSLAYPLRRRLCSRLASDYHEDSEEEGGPGPLSRMYLFLFFFSWVFSGRDGFFFSFSCVGLISGGRRPGIPHYDCVSWSKVEERLTRKACCCPARGSGI